MKKSDLLPIIICFAAVALSPASLLAQRGSEASSSPAVTTTVTRHKAIRMEHRRNRRAKVSTSVKLEGNLQTGNTDKASAAASAKSSVEDSIKEFSVEAKFAYSKNNGNVNQREFSGGLQFDYLPLSRLSPFARVEYYRNEFRKISGRYSALAGAKWRYFVHHRRGEPFCDYSISAAAIYENEDYTADANLKDANRCRLSVRPKFKQRLMQNISLQLETYYKPNVIDFSDYRTNAIAQLNFEVNRKVTLQVSYDYEYNSKPATAAVKPTDTALQLALEIKF
jgi:putative salt-induced outer membrane protein YdiY